jgi:putative tricarboxylic transport membrane protein
VRVAETIAAICVALLGLVTIALARQLPYEAEYGPGPGFLPLWLGATLVVLSVFLLRNALGQPAQSASAAAAGDQLARFFQFAPGALAPWLVFFVSTIAAALLFERLGFALAIGLYMLVTMRWVARQNWLSTIALAVATPFVLYLLFVRILRVPLPLEPPGL